MRAPFIRILPTVLIAALLCGGAYTMASAQSETSSTVAPGEPAPAPTPAPTPAPATAPAKISFPGMGETVLHISATERAQVPQDLLTASLRIEKENADAKAVQTEINTIMAKAVETAKAVTTVKVSTGHYYVYQYDPNPRPVEKTDGKEEKPAMKWRGSQSLQLQSTKADDLLKLAGALQDSGLVMENLGYSLSPEKAEEAKDSLMEAALAKVKTKAERAAKAMNKTRTDLVEINVDSSDNFIHAPVMMRAMAMDGAAMEKASAPTAAPGESEITLTVSAKALLK